MASPTRKIRDLAGALGLAVMVLALPVCLKLGEVGLLGLVGGGLACLIPGVLVVLLTAKLSGGSSSGNSKVQVPVGLILLGVGLRVGFVALVGILIVDRWPVLRSPGFFLGLAVLYFVALIVETRQLLEEIGPRRTVPPTN